MVGASSHRERRAHDQLAVARTGGLQFRDVNFAWAVTGQHQLTRVPNF
jgi:hypothetical protein